MTAPWPSTPKHRPPPSGRAERERVVRVVRVVRRHEAEIRARGVTRLTPFGSIARGEAGPSSDVDLLIEVDPDAKFTLIVAAEVQAAAERLGTPVEKFLARAVAEKVREAADDAVFERYATRFDEARIADVLARIPDAPPAPGDEIEPGPGDIDPEATA